MKAGKRFRKALRRVVAVPQGDVDDPVFRVPEVQRRLVQPAVPDILPDPAAAHQRKPPLEKERGKIHLIRHILRADVISQVFFHVPDRRADSSQPLHRFRLLSLM